MTRPRSSSHEELEARTRVLEEENDSLVEAAQATLLLRKIADVVYDASDVEDLTEVLLEHVGVLQDLPWSACFVLRGAEPVRLGSYSPVADEASLRVEISPDVFELTADELLVTDPVEARARGLRLDFAEKLGIETIFVYRFACEGIRAGLLVFADDRSRGSGFRAFLRDIGRMMVQRLDRLGYVSELERVNAELERRVVERTAELRASERRYRAIFEQAAAGIVNVSREGVLLQTNRRFLDMLGYSDAEELVGRHFQSLTHPSDRAEGAALARALWAGEIPHFALEKRYLRQDGSSLWGRAVLSLLRDDEGKPEHAVAVISDVSQHKETAAALHQIQKMESIGQLAGGIAHDFNNLLTPILTLSGLLIDELPEGMMREDVEAIQTAGERAAALTKKILSFSREQVLQVEPLDLGEVADEIAVVLRRTIRADVQLELDIDPSVRSIQADRVQLEQVLMNLVVNAQDAMPHGGMVRVEIGDLGVERVPDHVPEGDYVGLRVTDSGTGMDEATQRKIFDPFFTTKPVGRGTGLGLSTVHGVVNQHGGHLWVESSLGEGSSFTALFPVSESERIAPRSLRPRSSTRPAGRRVVVVEDDGPVRRLVVRVLGEAGYEVEGYRDGASCLMALEADPRPVDLLLTDVVMPKMTGWILHDALHVARPDLRVLFMSGYATDSISTREIVDRRLPILHKPLRAPAILDAVRRVLEEADRDDRQTVA